LVNTKNGEPRRAFAPAAPVPAVTVMSPWMDWARFGVVAAEFGLLVWIIRLFDLESIRFGQLVLLAWAGFVVHHLLPLRWRMPFFVILSLASLKLVAGGTVGIWITALGLVLIAICHLPIRFAFRVGLLLLVGILLACLRG